VTVDYYSDDHGNWQSDSNYPGSGFDLGITPTFNFVKKETWSYNLNGQEFLVPQGASYAKVVDSFENTVARILGGTNGSTAADYNSRPLTKAVNTGWTDADSWRGKCSRWFKKYTSDPASDILSITGMADLGTDQADVFALSMSYSDSSLQHHRGGFGLATKDAYGNWVNAVDMNIGGNKRFVAGPWNPQYGLGAYGVDPSTKTAWAVINYNSDFAVANFDK